MKATILTVSLIILCSSLNSANAQEQMQAKKYENPQWKIVELVEFKHDKMDRVREIIKNYFIKAAEKAGSRQRSTILELETGEWDMMLVWDMKEGLEEMNWQTRPDDIKWMNALNEIAGGTDKATAILDEWASLVVHSTKYLCRQF